MPARRPVSRVSKVSYVRISYPPVGDSASQQTPGVGFNPFTGAVVDVRFSRTYCRGLESSESRAVREHAMAAVDKEKKRTWLWIVIPALLWGMVQGVVFSWGLGWLDYAQRQWKNAGQEVIKDFRDGGMPDPEVIEAERDRAREEAISIMVPPLLIAVLLPLAARAIHKTWSIPLLAVPLGLVSCFGNFLPGAIAWPR